MRDDSRVLPRFFAAAGARRTVAAHSGEPPVRPPSREYPSNFPLLIRDLLNYAGPTPATDTPTDCRMLPMLVILEPGTVRVCESSSCRPADAVHPRDRRILEERRVKAPVPLLGTCLFAAHSWRCQNIREPRAEIPTPLLGARRLPGSSEGGVEQAELAHESFRASTQSGPWRARAYAQQESTPSFSPSFIITHRANSQILRTGIT